MKQRKPLDLLQKWLVTRYWVCQKPLLTRASLAVLMRLLDRQNPSTGRCDPSAVGLAEEIGLTERSVRGAFKELEERGALKRYRVHRRSRNQFLIFSVDEVEQNRRVAQMKTRAGQRTGLQPVAGPPEIRCRVGLQRTAPETIKETIKKKEKAESRKTKDEKSCSKRRNVAPCDVGLEEFERRVVKVFEKEGFGYVGLLELPAGKLEEAFSRFTDGARSFGQTVGDLLAEYKAQLG